MYLQTSTYVAFDPIVVRPLVALAQAWRTCTARWVASYRPEKHYMRGPGPKWHAKHAKEHRAAAQ